MKSSNPLDDLAEAWEKHDVFFLCSHYWNVELTNNQCRIVRAVAFPRKKRVVVSCITRYGKSFCVSMGVLLWIYYHEKKKVSIVAPTNEKTAIIRNHIYNFILTSEDFAQIVDMDKKGIERIRKEVSRKRMTFKQASVELRMLSAEGKGEQLMGFGADLVIADEECDIKYEVYRARITRMLGDNPDSVYVGIGNPWHRDNQMWQHWINPEWLKIHIGWEIALEEGRITQEFLDEQRAELTDIEFEVLYGANFPSTAPDALIEWAWIEKAYNNRPQPPEGKSVIGMDVAEMGLDLTVVFPGIINPSLYYAFDPESWGKTETMPTVGRTRPIIDKFNPVHIQVDATGIGSGVHSRLKEISDAKEIKCNVYAFKGGLTPAGLADSQRFANLKAQAYWYMRKLFEEGRISIPKHRVLIDQLSKMKWEFTSSHKIRIRDPGTKEGDTAEEKSPDFADALCYMCWEPIRTEHVVLEAFL